jgi:hypothetical protein
MANVVAIGDLHGDLQALERCLVLGSLVDSKGNWTAKDSALVVLGDTVDRWRQGFSTADRTIVGPAGSVGEVANEELTLIGRLNSLAVQARAHGSRVFRLVGNHELIQQLGGNYVRNYSSPFARGGDTTETMRARQESFRSGAFHEAIGECAPKAVVQIGSTVFCHGGLNDGQIKYAENEETHETGEEGVRLVPNSKNAPQNVLEFANAVFTDFWKVPYTPGMEHNGEYSNQDYKSMLMGVDRTRSGSDPYSGILWEDNLSHSFLKPDSCSAISAYLLAALDYHQFMYPPKSGYQKAERLVVSHHMQGNRQGESLGMVPGLEEVQGTVRTYTTAGAPQRFVRQANVNMQGINTECDGRVWRVDVGMSRAFLEAPFPNLKAQRETMRARAPAVLKITNDGEEFTIVQSVTPLPGQEPYLLPEEGTGVPP